MNHNLSVKDTVVKMKSVTPYCVTFDFDSLEDNQVTVRDRDSMEQVRMPISELEAFLTEKTKF